MTKIRREEDEDFGISILIIRRPQRRLDCDWKGERLVVTGKGRRSQMKREGFVGEGEKARGGNWSDWKGTFSLPYPIVAPLRKPDCEICWKGLLQNKAMEGYRAS
ncbi:hypothetical protein FF1_027267 [Malus domestica]